MTLLNNSVNMSSYHQTDTATANDIYVHPMRLRMGQNYQNYIICYSECTWNKMVEITIRVYTIEQCQGSCYYQTIS